MSKLEVQELLRRAVRGDIAATTELLFLDHTIGRDKLVELATDDPVPTQWTPCKFTNKDRIRTQFSGSGESRHQREYRLSQVA